MLCYFGAQLRPILPEQGFVRGLDGEGNSAALRQEAHFNGPVDQLVGNGYLVFPLAVIALQQRFPVFICPHESYNRALPVQIHLHLRVDGQIYGRIGPDIVLIIAKSEKQQETGCNRRDAAADPPGGMPLSFRRFFHQHRVIHRLPDFVSQIGRFQKASFFIQKNRVAGVAFHNQITHRTATPFITCFKCPRMISYPLV